MSTILYYVPDVGFKPEEKERRLALMQPLVPTGYQIIFGSPPGGPEFVDQEEDLSRAEKAVADHVGTISPQDCDVLVIGEALDVVVPLVRPLVRVPLIAPGEETLRLAALVGIPTSVVVMHALDKKFAQHCVETTPVKPEIVSIRSMDIPLRDLLSDLDLGRETMLREATAAVREDGAQAIYLGAMTLATLGLADHLRTKLGVVVYDPLRIALQIAVEVAYSRYGSHP